MPETLWVRTFGDVIESDPRGSAAGNGDDMTTTETKAAKGRTDVQAVAPDVEQHLSIRHTDAMPRQRDTCGLCGKPGVEPGWRVTTRGVAPLCGVCARRFPVHRAFTKRLNREVQDPSSLQTAWAILPPTQGYGRPCPGCRGDEPKTWVQPERRGQFEVGSVPVSGYSGGELAFCEDCLRERPETAALRKAVDDYYQKQGIGPRALKPRTEPPKPPSAEERAAAAKARRLAELAKGVGLALWPFSGSEQFDGHGEQHEAQVTRRASALMRAVAAWFDEREAE